MTQTGNGALTMEDIALLRTGYSKIVSRAPEHGVVILFDPTLANKFDPSLHTRIEMYTGTLITDEKSKTEGQPWSTLCEVGGRTHPTPTRRDGKWRKGRFP